MFKFTFERRAPSVALERPSRAMRRDARLEPARRDDLKEQLIRERLSNGGATEADTVRAAGLEVAGAQVTRRGAALAPVAHPQLCVRSARSAGARSADPARRAPPRLRRRTTKLLVDCRA